MDVHAEFWSGNLMGRNHFEDLDLDKRIILKMDLKEVVWKDVGWLRIGTGEGRL
jgi:hypothetical protein